MIQEREWGAHVTISERMGLDRMACISGVGGLMIEVIL